ncbi:MAG: sigma-54 dependent transcriptional regulator [Pseudomonadales bacterium]|nr:sigma-54 dependent transcriptional regulator [Pseudomonadales bacterium]
MNEREVLASQAGKSGVSHSVRQSDRKSNRQAVNLAATQKLLTPTSIRVLVVEDDLALQEAIVDTLELADFTVLAAASAEQALALLAEQSVDMVISDVNMGAMDGHQLLAAIKQRWPFIPVLLITAFATIDRSVSAIQSGAVDYLVKPFEPATLINLVAKYTIGSMQDEKGPVIASSVSREVFQMAKRVAVTDSTVLISGESGTGKEVVARYIHQQSPRHDCPFVAINCAAIPDTMLEATLFGHEKGAFTGAHQSAPGKFEQANGGTLLLDEVSELDLSLQAKLLRVLQEREVERVGSRKSINLDVRIIATTNRQLQQYVNDGKFREDLFYRLSVFPLGWPPLRDRRDDILPLADSILHQHTKKMGRSAVQLSASAQQTLQGYAWPGNVRELDNAIQRALIMQSGQTLYPNDFLLGSPLASASLQAEDQTIDQGLAINDRSTANVTETERGQAALSPREQSSDLYNDVKQHEFRLIAEALQATQGSKKLAAEQLGMSPRTLRYKMAKMRDSGYQL